MINFTPTRGQSILVEDPEKLEADRQKQAKNPAHELCGWIQSKVNIWEDARNRGYQKLWGEYWRMWRGQWNETDKNRLSERSKLVAPALSQAIEMTVSEIEEAVFSKEEWFDVREEMAQDLTAILIRDQLIDDLDKVNARDQIMEAITNGAIFGTMIAKINVFVGEDNRPKRDETTFELKAKGNQRVFVSIESIRPDEFIPDPVGRTVQEMLGCAQRIQRTMTYVLERIEQGVYRRDALTSLSSTRRIKNSDIDQDDPQSINTTYESNQVDIIEYHGKVPAKLLLAVEEARSALDELLQRDIQDEADKAIIGDGMMVEAIVTIANTGTLLKAMPNPFVMQDRSIVAAQFEKVPGRFWGRGVAEKGYNPQKALDSELRARVDALGFINAPMLGVDSGRLPRGFRMEVKPGKVWPTQGNPQEVLVPVKIGDYSTLTFQQTQEMERMVQMGTGAFDTASALKSQSQSGSNSSTNNSMLMGAFVKRAKRSINSIDRNFLTPVLNKVKWRYMQFDPMRYPADYEMHIVTTMGIVAREVEASQMTQLMGMMPEEFHNVQLLLLEGIVEHTSLANKSEILKAVQAITHPSPQAQQQMQQAQQQQQHLQDQMQQSLLQKQMLDNQKIVAEIKQINSRAHELEHESSINVARLHQDWERIMLQGKEQQQFAEQNQIAAARLPIEAMKAHAAIISAKRPQASSKK